MKRALWAGLAGFSHAVILWRHNPHQHVDPTDEEFFVCPACEHQRPWRNTYERARDGMRAS